MSTLRSGAPILLAYCWGLKNAGDLEITVGAARLLRSYYAERGLIVVSRYAENEPGYKETSAALVAREPGANVIGSPFPWYGSSPFAKIARTLASGILVLCVIISPRLARILLPSKALEAFDSSAIIFINGGNLFYWNSARRSISRIMAFGLPIFWAIRRRKKYAILPQSLGPFQGVLPRSFFASLFAKASFIMTRDPISHEHLRRLLGQARPVPMNSGLDLAFLNRDLDTDGAAAILKSTGLADRSFVAWTIRATRLADAGPLSTTETESIIRQLTTIADLLLSTREVDLLLVSQTIEDTKISGRVSEIITDKFPERCHAVSEMRPPVLRSLYQRSLMLMAMRLHSLIFATCVGVPVVGLFKKEWGPKMPGTMFQLGIGSRCYDIDTSSSEEIFAGVVDVLENRAPYADKIKASLNALADAQKSFLAQRVLE